MRMLYPIQSEELNDAFFDAYAKLVYLLGNDDEETGNTLYQGLYDTLDELLRLIIFEKIILRPGYYPEGGTDICGDLLTVNHLKQLRRM